MSKPTALQLGALGVCLSALSLLAHADQWADIAARKELKCGTFADVPPFAAPDPKTREMVGHDVDLCNALAKELGLTAKVTPLSVEARVPEVKLGRVDVTIANLAYTKSRGEQIQFSDPYYVAKEMLAVKASDPGTTKADFKGKRLSSTKGSTSELSIKMNGSEPVTFQDTGSAFMAVQQNKSMGMVANTMTITKLVNQSKTEGVPLKMIKEPMVLQPIGIGMKKDEPQLLAKVNGALYALEKSGELDRLWAKWLGPNTEYKLVREEKVMPLADLKFELLP
ncbi:MULTISPECIES: ABC transporter substrate-binding protein [Variovorax]|jgi:polar amino acid transport system substrate-binding protein|uniref:ABC transporter substrate-binding protein n=1 Tax=Variovorax ginsengisoli TaxID=363844 RepID=A0ABT8S3Z6_9BURK|nr:MULTISPECIES: ABC transporter substrate-binding protein [Variovorax]MDM0035784.1 ABC transporter substrate-binding protein [Variovorax sp. J22P271]MDN8613532.1 ABC transporter substrate-binding protein [Variovorax ginsengisoli]MDO1532702.1 ABC transporter substrate-binding protein [Variovorax ginsengisoli]